MLIGELITLRQMRLPVKVELVELTKTNLREVDVNNRRWPGEAVTMGRYLIDELSINS